MAAFEAVESPKGSIHCPSLLFSRSRGDSVSSRRFRSQIPELAISNHLIERMHVSMGKLLLLIALVIGIIWLKLLFREQDNRVALLSCCREQLYFFLSERFGRLRKDQIGVGADLFQLV